MHIYQNIYSPYFVFKLLRRNVNQPETMHICCSM